MQNLEVRKSGNLSIYPSNLKNNIRKNNIRWQYAEFAKVS